MSVKLRTSSIKFAAAEETEAPRIGRSSSSPAAYAQDRHAKAKAGQSTLKWDSCAAVESGAPGELLVVLDFDCTISAIHMHAALREEAGKAALKKDPAAFYLEVFGGTERLEKLREFLMGLRGAGATVYVLSNGFESEIDPALDDMDLHDYFERIIGCDGINAVACDDKTGMLAQFAAELAGACTAAGGSATWISTRHVLHWRIPPARIVALRGAAS